MRTQHDHLVLYGVIDGTRKPKTLQGYLQHLVDELDQLWAGVETYDAATGESFLMRAMLLCTIHDYVGSRDIAMQRGAGNECSLQAS